MKAKQKNAVFRRNRHTIPFGRLLYGQEITPSRAGKMQP